MCAERPVEESTSSWEHKLHSTTFTRGDVLTSWGGVSLENRCKLTYLC